VPDDDQHGVAEVREDGDDEWRLLEQLEVTTVRRGSGTISSTSLHTSHITRT